MDVEKLANILGAETMKKIYEDGLSVPVQEASKILTDFIKSARLFTAPFQLAAAYQDRLTKYFDRVRNAVPEEQQIEAPASLSGPIIDRLKYLEDSNYLTDMYLNLLSRAIDKKRINEAHPAFFHVIDQLSPDEVFFLYEIKDKEINVEYTLNYDRHKNILSNPKITNIGLEINDLNFPENLLMYIEHLESLNLIQKPTGEHEDLGDKIIKVERILNTEFGKLFIKACLPNNGLIIK